MKTLKITPPKGFEIDKDKSTFDEIVFKPINNWVNGWEQLKISEDSFVLRSGAGFFAPITFTDNINQYINLQKLIDLRDSVNKGWEPDWTDNSTKSCLINYINEVCIVDWSYTRTIIHFKDKETAERFLETHRELIESVKELL